MISMKFEKILSAIEKGKRLSIDEAFFLFKEADFLTLGYLAHLVRLRHNPEPVVTYIIDRNINITNVCESGCLFCAFFKLKDEKGSYVLTDEEIFEKIEETVKLKGTQILIQGGLNSEIGLKKISNLFKAIKKKYSIHIHGLSPPEIVYLANLEKISLDEVLDELIGAGLGSIPGGGAEILEDRVRKLVSPKKCTVNQWLGVMSLAHSKGLNSTATMMFGGLETPQERIRHLSQIRLLQEDSLKKGKGFFTAFIPWTFQPINTRLAEVPSSTAVDYLRMLAISRLFLNNFSHIQSSWVTQGSKIAQISLNFGADDLGSTMIEENVVAAAGVNFTMSLKEMKSLIEDLGYTPLQRDNSYKVIS